MELIGNHIEFFYKSFKEIIEKAPIVNNTNEKISMRSSLSRRKTSHFGQNYNFLSMGKPKIIKKNVII